MIFPRKRTIFIVLIAAFLFIFMYINSHSINFENHTRFNANLLAIKELDATINQNILELRYGLLTYYDPIVNHLAELKRLQNKIDRIPNFIKDQGKIEIYRLIQANIAIWREKENLIEAFKSQNAILKNSLYYFPMLATELAEKASKETEWKLATLLNELLRDVLIYNLTDSEDLAPKIKGEIEILFNSRNQYSISAIASDLEIAISHVKLILKNKPQVDNLIKHLVLLPTSQRSDELYKTYNLRYEEALKTANIYRLFLYIFSIVMLSSIFFYIIFKLRKAAQTVSAAQEALRIEKEKSELLLLNILPQPIAERLKQKRGSIADSFAEVTVLFADIVGFTVLSTHVSPIELVNLLNQIFSTFDRLSEKHGLEKIKTIGDAYMVVGGLPMPRSDHAFAIAEMALDMQQAIANFNAKIGESFSIRIGINTGPVVAGVIGLKKFIYDLWGDTVNTASRMESHGIPGCIQVTQATYELLRDQYLFEERGVIQVKGKGEMTTYFLTGRKVCNL